MQNSFNEWLKTHLTPVKEETDENTSGDKQEWNKKKGKERGEKGEVETEDTTDTKENPLDGEAFNARGLNKASQDVAMAELDAILLSQMYVQGMDLRKQEHTQEVRAVVKDSTNIHAPEPTKQEQSVQNTVVHSQDPSLPSTHASFIQEREEADRKISERNIEEDKNRQIIDDALHPERRNTRIGFRDINGDGIINQYDDVDFSGFADGGSYIDTPYDDVHFIPGNIDLNGDGKITKLDDANFDGYADGGRYEETYEDIEEDEPEIKFY